MLERIQKGKQQRPRRTVLYGVHGIGKSTWASRWPKPVFIPTEDGIADLDVESFPLAKTLQQAWEPVMWLGAEGAEHNYKTVVVDSADWLELLIHDLPVKRFGSQGQLKSFVLALKLAQYDFLEKQKSMRPILLLDDIFDKLDAERVSSLLQLLHHGDFGQVFITDTDEHRVENIIREFDADYRRYRIENGSAHLQNAIA